MILFCTLRSSSHGIFCGNQDMRKAQKESGLLDVLIGEFKRVWHGLCKIFIEKIMDCRVLQTSLLYLTEKKT